MKKIFASALLAGVIAACAVSGVQFFKTVPLILAAETYEKAEAPAPAHTHDHAAAPGAAADHHHDADAWEPEDGAERIGFTLLANLLTGVGFGFMLCGALALYAARGGTISVPVGLAMGGAGFLAFALAPSLGLPPELPGMAAAELTARQTWWLGTAVATLAGLIALTVGRVWLVRIAGIAVLLLPHLIGAPHISGEPGGVPPALAAEFVAASLVAAAVFWATLGAVSGWALRRLA